MKETGTIFGTESVQAILNNRKAMTRRLRGLEKANKSPSDWYLADFGYLVHHNPLISSLKPKCPYGQVGDRLWVRETWWRDQSGGCWGYKAEGREWPPSNCGGKAMSSIFMPRWASRITLEITDIRVERLQEITEEDAWAEGCSPTDTLAYQMSAYPSWNGKLRFKELWDSLNAKRGYGWDKNPWVWVISFRRLQ
jgi:hypothetical protein